MVGKLIASYCRLLAWLMAICLAIMVVLVFANVVLRYGFSSGITVSEELSRWLFVWMTFLGAVVALREGSHLGSDTLVSRLPLAGKKAFFALGHLLMLYVCWLLFKGSWDQTMINLTSTSAAMEVSMGIFYASGLVAAVSMSLVLLHRLFRLLTGRVHESELIGVRESEEAPVDALAPIK